MGATQFRLRFDAPIGTRAEDTERLVTGVLDEIRKAAGPDNVAISSGLRRHARRKLSHQYRVPVDQRAARSGH